MANIPQFAHNSIPFGPGHISSERAEFIKILEIIRTLLISADIPTHIVEEETFEDGSALVRLPYGLGLRSIIAGDCGCITNQVLTASGWSLMRVPLADPDSLDIIVAACKSTHEEMRKRW